MEKTPAPTPKFVSPGGLRTTPYKNPTQEQWNSTLERNTQREINEGIRTKAKGAAAIAAMTPEQRKKLGL